MADKMSSQQMAGDADSSLPPPPSYSQAVSGVGVPNPSYHTMQPGFVPVTTAVPTNVIISRPTFGPFPVEMDCPYCQAHVVTSTLQMPGALPWIIFSLCFVLGFFLVIPWCLCCIPFFVESWLDVTHNCPNCKRPLGRFSRI